MNVETKIDPIDLAWVRSATYGLLAHGFRAPESDVWALLTDRAHWAGWPEVLSDLDFDSGDAARRIQELLLSPDPTMRAELEEARVTFGRVFGHTARGSAPPYEMEFGASEIFQRSAELSDIQGFYRAFGFDVRPEAHERPDHISIECEFMSALAAKEAFFLDQGQDEGLATVRRVQGTFLEAHLAKWLPAFANKTEEADPEGIYGALARLGAKFIVFEARTHQVPCGPSLLELREVDEEDETLQACAKEDFGGACPSVQEAG